jgi:hypothetical protein
MFLCFSSKTFQQNLSDSIPCVSFRRPARNEIYPGKVNALSSEEPLMEGHLHRLGKVKRTSKRKKVSRN